MRMILILSLFIFIAAPLHPSYASCKAPKPNCTYCGCDNAAGDCQNICTCVSDGETGNPGAPKTTIGHITDEFSKHRKWLTDAFFKDSKAGDAIGLLAAIQLMTEQLTTTGMHQVQIIGKFFDAKHQLETQRLFQELTIQAHKDYHPSEGICIAGTTVRSLAQSARNSDLSSTIFANRIMDRQLLTKSLASESGNESDKDSRLVQFIKQYCNTKDNAENLNYLCIKSENNTDLLNQDINYTNAIENALTLDIDFSNKGAGQTDATDAFFALTSNLISNETYPNLVQSALTNDDGTPKKNAIDDIYIDARSLIAKRSVAANSLSAIAALKTKGDAESKPFLYAILKEMGGNKIDEETIKKTIGDSPSYFAQMEVLTKTLYQSPNFYADLYDKPANVLRKNVALQAATIMQKRDLYRSYLRSEMTLAVMLETALMREQESVTNEVIGLSINKRGR